MQKKSEMSAVDNVSAALSSDDILCEILIRLPPELVFRSLLVSKRWLNFICSSTFLQYYLNRWPVSYRLLGFFISNSLYLKSPKGGQRRPKTEPALPLLPTCQEGDELSDSAVLKPLGYLMDSANGLLLCGRHPKSYFVWNPITNERQELPHPRVHFDELCMAFLVDNYPVDDICYKVIRAKCESIVDDSKTVTIETYHSKTRTWYYSKLACSSALALTPWLAATVIRGVVHWYAAMGNLAIYDPQRDSRRIEVVKLPGSNDYEERALGESSDGLLQYGWSKETGMEIWVLRNDKCSSSGAKSSTFNWNLNYRLKFKTMWKRSLRVAKICRRFDKETQILSFHPKDSSSVYIRSGSEIFLYHVGTEKIEPVLYNGRGSSIMWDFSRVVPYFRPCWPHSSLCAVP
ncbi:F-box protein At5g03970 [Linum perenne]